MKVALIGYGKMGKKIEECALARGDQVTTRIQRRRWDEQGIAEADLCIEFTSPDGFFEHVQRLLAAGKPIVVGTTGWEARESEIKKLVEEAQGALLYSPNFSLGAQLFFLLAERAASLLGRWGDYSVAGIEYHHAQKKDAPSGTALALSKRMAPYLRGQAVPFTSLRLGSIPGTHTLLFDSPCDSITLTHEARHRGGFAEGALLAGQWLLGKRGCYTFSDCINDLLKDPLSS